MKNDMKNKSRGGYDNKLNEKWWAVSALTVSVFIGGLLCFYFGIHHKLIYSVASEQPLRCGEVQWIAIATKQWSLFIR